MFRGTGSKLRQRVRDVEPRGLRPHPEVPEGAPTGIIVDDTQPETQHVWRVGAPAVDGRTTATAECAENSGRRLELSDEVLAREKRPVLPPDVRVGAEGRPAGFPASGAVAVNDGPHLTGHL